jgi:LysM repeat protein
MGLNWGTIPMQTRSLHAAAAVVFAGFLAGCEAGPPMPTVSGDSAARLTTAQSDAVAIPGPVASRQAPQNIVVRAGQSISRIAAEYRVPRSAIIAVNHLTPPYKIKIGQQLVLPSPDTSIVAPTGSEVSKASPLNEPAPPGPTASPSPSTSPGRSQADASSTATAPVPTTSPSLVQEQRPREQASKSSPNAIDAPTPIGGKNQAVTEKPLRAPVAPDAEMTERQPASSESAVLSVPDTNVAAPVPTTVATAAPPGATCPPGTTGTWSVDVIKIPIYVCR